MNNTFIDEYGKTRTDALNEQNLVFEFNSIIESTQFHVYGFSGDWGTGKSTFVQMWENSVNKDNYSVIKIDAFERDYIQDPFTMIYSAFKKFMKENKISKDAARPIIEKAKRLAFISLKSAGQFTVNFLIDKIGQENVKDLVSTLSDSLFDEFDYDTEEKVEDLCKELKNLLKQMIEGSKKKLYIVIDELDRCRPDFALETLEKIKHLFAVDGVKFILVYNPSVISNIVKNKYGIDDINNRYIKKFIEKEIPFVATITFYKQWIRSEAKILSEKGVDPNLCNFIAGYAEHISRVMTMYGLSLRDTQWIFKSIENLNTFTDFHLNMVFGILLALFKGTNIKEYEGMIDYLQKNNGTFASDVPVRINYNKIASLFFSKHEVNEREEFFIEYFKNEKQY